MKFIPENFNAPELLRTDEFIVRPLQTSDVELDYDAVMSSKEMLRVKTQSDWPADGFTIEDNLEDLERHEIKHHDRKAFTFTIMNPDQSFCLGCVYFNPLSQELSDLKICDEADSKSEIFCASITFWVRESLVDDGMDLKVLNSLAEWLEDEWHFDCVIFPVSKPNLRQNQLLKDKGHLPAGDFYDEQRASCWNIYLLSVSNNKAE